MKTEYLWFTPRLAELEQLDMRSNVVIECDRFGYQSVGTTIGPWLVLGGAHGWLLRSDERTVASEIRYQNRTLVPLEDLALRVLRGAHNRTAGEISEAFRALGLGSYHTRNPVLRALQQKGRLRTHSVLTPRGAWAERPPANPSGQPLPIREAWWKDGLPLPQAPVYGGEEWWEVVGWPEHRGGRPRKT